MAAVGGDGACHPSALIERPISIKDDRFSVRGKLDLAYPDGTRIAVVDWKIGKSEGNDDSLQLLSYALALLHESCLGYLCRMLFFVQLISSTRYDWGLPRWIIRLRIAQPRRLSTC